MEKFSIQKGFTLIELLVVIVIIGILASFLMTNYVGVRMRSRDAQRKSDLKQIQSALEMYRSDVGNYPTTASFVCGNTLQSGGVTYMQKIPCDPTNTSPLVYGYQATSSTFMYTLAACLENTNDGQKDTANNPDQVDGSASITNCAGGSSNWSYTLYSP